MTDDFPRMAFPSVSQAYREARNALLDAEIALRRQTEVVAAMRRALPPGGEVPEDYVFERIGAKHRPSASAVRLFGEHRSIVIYSSCSDPRATARAPDARTCSTASTARRGTCRTERRCTSSPPRRSPGSPPGRIVAAGTISS